MSELSVENWMAIIGVSIFFIFGISTFLFGRITVKHIERAMAKEGIDLPIWDKGIGARIVAYAGRIAFPNLKRHASLVNIEATKRFTREKDKKLAWLYIISVASFFIVLIVFYLFFEFEKNYVKRLLSI